MYGCFPRTAPTVSHNGISLSSKMRRRFGGRVKDEVANVPTTGITGSAELGIVTKKKKMKKKRKYWFWVLICLVGQTFFFPPRNLYFYIQQRGYFWRLKVNTNDEGQIKSLIGNWRYRHAVLVASSADSGGGVGGSCYVRRM